MGKPITMPEQDIDNDLNLLKFFEALFEEGGASRAAIRLGVTQSAVSAALRRLRRTYSDELFVRVGRGLMPTARADELMPVIGEALEKWRQSLALASPKGKTFHGRSVAIGLSDDFEIWLGQGLILDLQERAAGLRLIFRQVHSQVAGEFLLTRKVDLVISAGGLGGGALRSRALGESSYACVVDSRRNPAQSLSLEEYINADHVLISAGGVAGIVDTALAEIGRRRKVVASTTHFAALPFFLSGTKSIATVPRHAAVAIERLTGLRMINCPLDLPRYVIELGWRHDIARDAAVAVVRGAIVDRLARLREL